MCAKQTNPIHQTIATIVSGILHCRWKVLISKVYGQKRIHCNFRFRCHFNQSKDISSISVEKSDAIRVDEIQLLSMVKQIVLELTDVDELQ